MHNRIGFINNGSLYYSSNDSQVNGKDNREHFYF